MTGEGPSGARGLDALLAPRHVAVVGASRTAGKNGWRVAANLIRGGFAGPVTLVGAAGGEIDGHRFVGSIADAEGPVDLALLVVPADATVEAVGQCAEAGVRAVIIASVGFAELGTDEGRDRQDAIVRIARRHGMRILGPNTNGILNAGARLFLGYNTAHGEPMEPGSISVVSHSGALMTHLARRVRQLGAALSKFVPMGNEADVGMLDVLEHLIEDEDTRVIAMIIEGLDDGPRLGRLAAAARAWEKPIIALKLGRSSVGAASSLAHSSRLAGNARAWDALLDSLGIARVSTIEALAGGAAILAGCGREAGRARDRRLVCVSSSGAGAALLADFAERHGMGLAVGEDGKWEPGVAERLASFETPAPIRNPIDTGSLGGLRKLAPVLDTLADAGLDGPTVVFTHTILTPGSTEAIANAVIARRARTGTPAVLLSPGGLGPEIEGLYRAGGVPVFYDTETCFESLGCHFATLPHGEAARGPQAGGGPTGGESAPSGPDRLAQAVARLRQADGEGRTLLGELESAQVLAAAGLPMVESRQVPDLDHARRAAAALGYPVVVKALPPGVAHKHALGLVVTGIADARALETAWRGLEQRLAAHGLDRTRVPAIVQPMRRAQAELLLGVSREPGLGHFLVLGLGGVLTEALDEVVLVAVPATGSEIARRLARSRTGRLVERLDQTGALAAGIVGLAERLQSLVLACADRLESVDINPLLVEDEQLVAVDALIVLQPAASRRS